MESITLSRTVWLDPKHIINDAEKRSKENSIAWAAVLISQPMYLPEAGDQNIWVKNLLTIILSQWPEWYIQ